MLTFKQLDELVPEEDAENTEIVFRRNGTTSQVETVSVETDLETGERRIVLS